MPSVARVSALTQHSRLEHPGVRAISFTGGTITGKRVAATVAPLFKKLR